MNYDKLLNRSIQQVKPSGIRKFFDILNEMEDAISLGIGEPDFGTPQHIRQAGIDALQAGHTKYTSNAGMHQLREAICAYLKRSFDFDYNPDTETLVTVGGSEGIDLALRCLVNPGDEVIIHTPSFVCYGPLAEMAGGVPVYLPLKEENQFRLTAQELKSAITPKTKALILAFPCNPTGAIMERSDLEAIAEVLRDTDITVITDEIYAELTYGQKHVSIVNIPGMRERTILINGFSKSYAMTGWRMGYACAPAPIIDAMTKLHQFGIMSAPTISQYAALEAMEHGDDDYRSMRDAYDQRRKFVVEGFNRLGLPCFEPKGAFYAFPNLARSGMTSEEFCLAFLEAERVAIIPGDAFGPGGEGFARVCYASSMEKLQESMDRLARFMTTHHQ